MAVFLRFDYLVLGVDSNPSPAFSSLIASPWFSRCYFFFKCVHMSVGNYFWSAFFRFGVSDFLGHLRKVSEPIVLIVNATKILSGSTQTYNSDFVGSKHDGICGTVQTIPLTTMLDSYTARKAIKIEILNKETNWIRGPHDWVPMGHGDQLVWRRTGGDESSLTRLSLCACNKWKEGRLGEGESEEPPAPFIN